MSKRYIKPIGCNEYALHKSVRRSGKALHSLFKNDPKGGIEERRVKVLYANGFNDISGKL